MADSTDANEAAVLAGLLDNWISPEAPQLAAEEVVTNLNKLIGETRMKQIYALLAQDNISEEEKDKLQLELKQIILERGNNYGSNKKSSG